MDFTAQGENLLCLCFLVPERRKGTRKVFTHSFTTISYETTAPLTLDSTVGSSPGSAHGEAEPHLEVLLPHLSFSKPSTKPPWPGLCRGLRVNIERVYGPVV